MFTTKQNIYHFMSFQLDSYQKLFVALITRKKFFPNWDPLEVFNKLLFQNAFGQWSHGKGFPQFQVKSHYESSTNSYSKMILGNDYKKVSL